MPNIGVFKIHILLKEVDQKMNQNKKRASRKSWVLLLLLLLALASLLTVGGVTFAKYVTSGSGSGTASVAKWGYEVKVNATDIFGTEYKYDTTANSSITNSETGSTVTVKANDTANRVAPGTSGSMTFSIKGSAEVLAALSAQLTADKDVALTFSKGSESYTYAPVKWTLNDGTSNVVDAKTLADVVTEIDRLGQRITPNSTTLNKNYTLSWTWSFETAGSTVPGLSNNDLDTILGLLANGENADTVGARYGITIDSSKTSTEIDFKLSISIEQLSGNS